MPSHDVLWAAAFAACAAIVGWCVSQIISSKSTQQRLTDHIAECDKRQAWIMDKLEAMDRKLDKRWWR